MGILTRSNGKLPVPTGYDAENFAYENVDMAFQDGVHVLKYAKQGGSSVKIVKFIKSFTMSSDIISILDLPV